MRTLRMTMAAALLLALSGVAQAATLYTQPMSSSALSSNPLRCRIVNVGKKALAARIQAMDENGSVAADSSDLLIPAGGVRQLDVFPIQASANYCKFTVKGGKKKVRAGACIFESGVGCTAAAPAY